MYIQTDKMKKLFASLLLAIVAQALPAQEFNQIDEDGNISRTGDRTRKDSLHSDKEAPRGLYVWTVDERFGDRKAAQPDTLQHMYMNSIFNEGVFGEYNTLGNLGSPRLNRIYIDRREPEQFMFTQPYDFFNTPVDKFHFTNTLSPITNLTYQECGDKTNGEDHLKALFATNAGKRLGVGFKFNYIYARGYYQNQSAAHFNYTMFGSYLGDRYEAHLLMETNHQKMAENGGIANDDYVVHPEKYTENFAENEIPTFLSSNWNRNDHHHIFFSHRYNVGFNRKVPMTAEEIKAKKFALASAKEKAERDAIEKARRAALKRGEDFDEEEFKKKRAETSSGRPDDAKTVEGELPGSKTQTTDGERIKIDGQAAMDSLKNVTEKADKDSSWFKYEYVPVTSFIHTMKYDYARRIYQAYDTPAQYYKENSFYSDGADVVNGDSIYDLTRHYRLKNTLAINLMEGFNKWAKSGLKVFASSDLRHFTLPDNFGCAQSYNEHTLSIGGQLSKMQGRLFHYDVVAETWTMGEDAGQLKLDANLDLNFPLFGDTVRLAANGYFHRLNPTFYQRHFHSKHLWWDYDDMNKETRTHVEGRFSFPKTGTMLRVAVDNLSDYVYFAQSYNIVSEGASENNNRRTGNVVTVNQSADNISLLTLQLNQNFRFGIFNWESQVTYQKTSSEAMLPVPELNLYTNLYVKFRINKVLHVDLGGDLRWFTKYYAPDYDALIGQYTVQNNGDKNVEIGNYPWVDVYANLKLKQARFYVMMSHVNYSEGGKYFLTPHYPTNQRIFRVGVSWNFFN